MRWARLAATVRRRIRYKIARGGILFTLALVLVGAAALVSANNLLFLIVAAMLATLLVSGFVSRLVLAGLQIELALPEHISARAKTPAILRLRNWKRWMPSFSIRVSGTGKDQTLTEALYFPVIPGRVTLEERVELEFPRRGVHTDNLFVFTTRFPFGFLEKTAMVHLKRETVVYPSIAPQPEFEWLLAGITGELETHFRGRGTDFYRIRPYEVSESARHVDWKSTAHTGDLQVREFAREQQRTVEIFLDRNVDAVWFERAVECCAYLAWELGQNQISVQFRSQGFSGCFPDETDVYTILKFLAFVQPLADDRPYSPFDDSSFQILVSSSPQRFIDAGWAPAHLVDRSVLAGADGSANGHFAESVRTRG
jgi:uncharacterized protein (DUF58 family)